MDLHSIRIRHGWQPTNMVCPCTSAAEGVPCAHSLIGHSDALSYIDVTKDVARASAGIVQSPGQPNESWSKGGTPDHTHEGREQAQGAPFNFDQAAPEEPVDSPTQDSDHQTIENQQPSHEGQSLPGRMGGDLVDEITVSSSLMQTRPVEQTRSPSTISNNEQSLSAKSQAQIRSPALTTHSLTSGGQSILDAPYPSYAFPSPYYASPDALHGLPEKATHQAYTNLQEACLVKHFINKLAHAFETTDRDRHFSLVIPQRAMFCPVLLYAILTASARHLTRLHSALSDKPVEFEGTPLPDLNENSAIEYHNICISYLMEVLNDPKKTINQDALIAATILRFHEQIDTPLTGWDSETYLSVLRGVIESQQNESFYSLRTIHGPPRDCDIYASNNASLAHSACLIALRQEIWSVLLYRRPFRLPLCPDNDYSNLDPATDDYTWTNRILIWCADVCKFAFGGEASIIETSSRVERWKRLKVVQDKWDSVQPACFKPLYYREAEPSRGKYFPEEWHMNDCQVLGLQHFELARMVLAAYDPDLQRIGLGASSSILTLEAQLRRSTMRLCGLALANLNDQPGMVTAAVGISMCGEYIRDPGEQNAIEGFLNTLEREHAWPTQSVRHALRDAWEATRKQSAAFSISTA
ncbi:uncharacterized protein Z519_02722 [Cladophialophora bantiana CBS 173.52]|uniref:Uncharacterized protein n=1 Tax=Cladophialophora bantiana (strain ATCC 10958 / CBS 173.52 / CDC B-1940 / NIH 8579) TaxID=1442370 RepID=A0A0D2I292_CLAB1|nr:uncharacterized protein Z519_02722 [Cladophialophora bantiana CBS 173.52]KIW97330.1 hypothetical protein Z519_02722 [Cladophialophora bantiana CBS 173.52]